MNGLIIFVSAVFILQIVLFFVIRKKRREEKKHSVIEKYNIKSSGDAFRLLQDADVPDDDKSKIEELYHGKET